MLKKIKKIIKQDIASLILPYLPWQLCDFGFSGRIIVEPTNLCNLHCALCPVPLSKRAKGFLSFDNFKKIVDDIPKLKFINFGYAGEPLLNKELFKMIKYASGLGIKTSVSTNTVFLHERIDEVLDSGLNNLIVCLDGATKEAHEKYRIGSNFESVRGNIKQLCDERKKRGLKEPWITLQSLVTKYSENEMSAMTELAKSLGADSVNFKSLSLGSSVSVSDVERKERAEKFLPSAKFSRYDFIKDKLILKSKPKLCSWLRQAVILWNGDVSTCCYDVDGALVVGNVLKDGGFQKVWRSEKYRKFRKKIMRYEFALCRNCTRTEDYAPTTYFLQDK